MKKACFSFFVDEQVENRRSRCGRRVLAQDFCVQFTGGGFGGADESGAGCNVEAGRSAMAESKSGEHLAPCRYIYIL